MFNPIYQIVFIVAGIEDIERLDGFFAKARRRMPEAAFIMVQPAGDVATENQYIHAVSTISAYSIKQVREYAIIDAGCIYAITQDNILQICNSYFTTANSLLATSFSSPINTFWESAAHYCSDCIVLVMQPRPSYIEGLSHFKEVGGEIILCENSLISIDYDEPSLWDFYDDIMPLDEVLEIININFEYESGNPTGKDTYKTTLPPLSSPDLPPPKDFSKHLYQVALNHATPTLFFDENFEVRYLFGNIRQFMLPEEDNGNFMQHSALDQLPKALIAQIYNALHSVFEKEERALLPFQADFNLGDKLVHLSIDVQLYDDPVAQQPLAMVKLRNKVQQTPLHQFDANYNKILNNQQAEIELIPPLNDSQAYRESINNLGQVNDDLNNLLQHTDIGVLFLDENLHVRKFTSSFRKHLTFNAKEERGCHLSNITFHIDYNNILEDAYKVLDTNNPIETQVQGTNGSFLLQIAPYVTGDNILNGLIIKFINVTDLHKTNIRLTTLARQLEQQGVELLRKHLALQTEITVKEQTALELSQQKNILESVLNSMREAVVLADDNGKVLMLNKMAQKMLNLELDDCFLQWVSNNEFLHPLSNKFIDEENNPILLCLQHGELLLDEQLYICSKLPNGGMYLQINSQKLPATGQSPCYVFVMSDISDRKKSEIELRNSEATKSAVLQAIPDLMFRVNREGTYVDYQPAKDETEGLPPATFIGNQLADILPENLVEKFMSNIKQVLRDNSGAKYRFEILTEDLRSKFYEADFAPLADKEEVLCIVRNITDMVVAREGLRRSSAYYKALIETSPAPIMILDRSANFVYINPEAKRLLGWQADSEGNEGSIYDYMSKSSRIKAREAIKQGFAGNPYAPTLYKFIRPKDERTLIAEAVGSIISYENRLVLQVVLHDITKQVEIQKELKNSHKKYKKLFELIPKPIALVDISTHRLLECNSCLTTILGYSTKKELNQITLEDITMPNVDITDSLPEIQQAFEQGSSFCLKWPCRRKNGESFIAYVELTPFSQNDSNNVWMISLDNECEM